MKYYNNALLTRKLLTNICVYIKPVVISQITLRVTKEITKLQ